MNIIEKEERAEKQRAIGETREQKQQRIIAAQEAAKQAHGRPGSYFVAPEHCVTSIRGTVDQGETVTRLDFGTNEKAAVARMDLLCTKGLLMRLGYDFDAPPEAA